MRVGSNLARRAPRNADFGELQETFLVAAVATILVIRTQLWLAAQDKLDVVQKRCALELLDGADPTDPVVAPLRRLLAELDAIPAAPPSRAARWAGAVRAGYLRFIERRAFRPIVGWIFAISTSRALSAAQPPSCSSPLDWSSFAGTRGSTRIACSIARCLVSIFGTRVFAFVESQFGAVFGLRIDLLMLVTVRYIAEQERRLDATTVDRPARRRLRSAADGLASPASQ
jgi:hypothetical protein